MGRRFGLAPPGGAVDALTATRSLHRWSQDASGTGLRLLARHLHALALLDDLPEHLAATVRDSIRRDRSLLGDDGLGVWLDAVLETGDTRQLSLRWAQGLTDSGLGQLRSRAEWASTLVALDPGM